MTIKTDINKTPSEDDNNEIVVWEPKYAVGIKLIDTQHRELIVLTNQLYRACVHKGESIETVFLDAMHKMVDYVRFHFKVENALLERIKYPDCHDHKKQHETLIKNILDAAKEYEEGKRYVPNTFVRTLRDWVFGHIAFSDQIYAAYVVDQRKKDPSIEKLLEG